jgi:hypothetical protein
MDSGLDASRRPGMTERTEHAAKWIPGSRFRAPRNDERGWARDFVAPRMTERGDKFTNNCGAYPFPNPPD